MVESLDEADETADRGDQTSESLAADDGGDESYDCGLCDRSRGLVGNVEPEKCPLVRGPLRDGGGDIGLGCVDWKPSTWRLINSFSVSIGDNALIVSRKRWARAIRKVFGEGIEAPGIIGACNGDIVGVSGGVARPIEGCIVVPTAATDTVAMT